MWKGVLILESLENDAVLASLKITRTETWQAGNAAEYQPRVWTALSFEAENSQADALAGELSRALKARAWYINASDENQVYVIFPGRVYKYPKGDQAQRAEVTRYALSIGVPGSQLDWSE